ncbi:sulfite reductase subunit alpha [Coralloluteibacterium thermophilus]|uniref:NADPH--hemoprotein reductase n=1 Tax=Coralloluteibacterium thermophilum TaxID=2707049 RepID=A0ABV9NNK6_9GAMM
MSQAQRMRAVLGNGLALGLLLVMALALARLQGEALWRLPDVAARDWLLAGTVLAAYVGAVAVQVGWRRRTRRMRTPAGASDADALPIYVASQTGFADELAWRSAEALAGAGVPARVLPLSAFAPEAAPARALFVVSTTGEGDAPDGALRFVREVLAHARPLPHLRYGLLSLGDSEYAAFCGFGRRLESWLRHNGAQPLFDTVEVDNADPGALRHWLHHLGQLAGTHLPDWEPPRYARWRLHARRLLNPGSAGAPAFHLALRPDAAPLPAWEAGDIAEVGPRHAPARVAALLAARGWDGDEEIECDGQRQPLAQVLAEREHLPALAGEPAPAYVARLPRLPHREYSIASVPGDGALELVVRQQRDAAGALGLGSGWLTAHAAPGEAIALRIRSNRGFHPPDPARPLILVGNGTGIAGLRAHLKARALAGARRNWLLFGERSRAHDRFFGEELAAWEADGLLARLDLAFSRDPPGRVYVQDLLAAAADPLRAWIDDGAAVYVCGSLQGMAPAVDAVLREALGEARVDALVEEGRYRRDVY